MTKPQIEKSIITDWIYEINKPIFFCVLVLIAIGLFISLTINPGTSRYINNNLFSYFNIQALYLLFGFIIFILFSISFFLILIEGKFEPSEVPEKASFAACSELFAAFKP